MSPAAPVLSPAELSAIARIEVLQDDRLFDWGTAFLVGRRYALTTLHVVADRRQSEAPLRGDRFRLHFFRRTADGSLAGVQERAAVLVPGRFDADLDWALLELNEPIDDIQPLDLRPMAPTAGAQFRTYGYARTNPRDGLVFSGHIENEYATCDGARALQLYSLQAAAPDTHVSGLSGAPVFCDGGVVGIVRAFIEKEGAAVAGTIYACPVALPFSLPEARLPREPDSAASIEPGFEYKSVEYRISADAKRTLHLLTPDSFHQNSAAPAQSLAVGFRPTLALLRDRQFMPRPNYLASAAAELSGLLAEKESAHYHELPVFWITGRSGSGKTVLLLQLMEFQVRKGRRVLWLDDDTAALLPLLKSLHPDAGLEDAQLPDMIFVDDAYSPKGQQDLIIDELRRLVSSALERPWPIVVTCGPPEFEKQLERDAANDCIHVHPWLLSGIDPQEAESFRTWFEGRTGLKSQPGSAFEQSQGLIISMAFEMQHGRLEPFARRFSKRLAASELDQSLRLPLALNRLYLLAPTSWLNPAAWERLDELNRDADFSVLEAPHGAKYLRLTHPHLSDSIYRALRVPGNARAYANDLAEALCLAWETDVFTLQQILREFAKENERLAIVDMDHLAETVGRKWQQSELRLLRQDKYSFAMVYGTLAVWGGRHPELRLDERFGHSLLDAALAAMDGAEDAWPIVWLRLHATFPNESRVLTAALHWLRRPETAKNRRFWLILRAICAEKAQISPEERQWALGLAWSWLRSNKEGNGWDGIFETLLDQSSRFVDEERKQLIDLGLRWVTSNFGLGDSVQRVWQRLLSDGNLRDEQKKSMLWAGARWLGLHFPKRGWGVWKRIWCRLADEPVLPPGMDRRKLVQMGYSCLADREPGMGASFVWERLLDEAQQSTELDRGELLRWGQRFLRRNPSQGDWSFVWERLYKESGLSAEDRQELSHAGFLWLQVYEERHEWVFVWKQLVESRALPEGVDHATLVALGQQFLANQEEAKSWMHVWGHLTGLRSNYPALLDADVLAEQGLRWMRKHGTQNLAPTLAARVLALSSHPEKYDPLAASLAGWLAENTSNNLTEIATRILMPHATRLARSGESGAAPGCIKLRAWLGRIDDALTPLEFMMNQRQPILGTISARRREGYTVDLAGTCINAFLPDLEVWPGTEIGSRRPGSHKLLQLGLKGEFVIVKIDRSRAQVVVALRGVHEKELRERRQRWLAERKLGEIVKGTVKRLSPNGVFVSLAVLVVKVSIDNLSWLRLISHYGLLKSGQEIELVVSRIDVENVTIGLALKPAPSESWDEVKRAVSKTRVYEGQLIALASYGVYVEIVKGVVGLLPSAAIYNVRFLRQPGDKLALGRVLKVAVREINSVKQQILLKRY